MQIDPQRTTPGALYRFMISAIIPRPIAFVSTVDANGHFNVAPFSYFAPLSSSPPLLGISIGERNGEPKHTLANARATGDFVVNIVTEAMLKPMVRTSGDWDVSVDEFEIAGLTRLAPERVRAPRVAESPIQFECRVEREVSLGASTLLIGEIVLVHVADALLADGLIDASRLLAVGRLGGDGYAVVRDVIHEPRPVVPKP